MGVTYRDHHATIFVAPEVAGVIETARRAWDPGMAAQIAAHVTLAYPQEAPAIELLAERVGAACRTTSPFRLRLGAIACFERPDDGVYVTVHDVDGGYDRLRREVLRPPFQPAASPPHVTIVHPRTSQRGREFWERGAFEGCDAEFTTREVSITAFDGTRWVALMRFPLAGVARRP